MKQIMGFMFAMILLPIASFGAEYSFAELLKREINGLAKVYFKIDDISESKETGEILLRKYSGKIDGDEVSFFIQIDKDTNSILGGVIALPNEPMIPLKLIRILSDDDVGGYTIGMELTSKLELQIVYDRKLTTFVPQCPAQNLCSYIQDEEMMYFPSLQMAFLKNSDFLKFETFGAKTYEEAKKIIKHENRKYGFQGSSLSMLFVNDSYMSFLQYNYANFESINDIHAGAIFDIKTKKSVDLGNMLKTGVPYSLYYKYYISDGRYGWQGDRGSSYIDGNDKNDNRNNDKDLSSEPCKDCPKKVSRLSTSRFGVYINGYVDGFHYGYREYSYSRFRGPINGDFDDPDAEWVTREGESNEELLIPLKELKPYMKPEWYSYLIGKGELPKDASAKRLN